VLVARHGSVKAAAAELGVTEPAVSVAVSALRKELGDELFVRDGRGIALTAGGHRLAALASEILGPAEQARRSVHDGPGQSRLMRVAVTNVVAEYVGPLIDALTARDPGLDVQIDSVPGSSMADLLEHRRADITLGPPPAPERANTIAIVLFLRCRLIVAAAPGHPLAGQRDLAPARPALAARSAGPRSHHRRRPAVRAHRHRAG
jgi:DNA-binding transcriptional LysR family regulator